jgi:glucokinase-like ROK family protein
MVRAINTIRNNDGISRAQMVKTSGLSAPTITRIVERLMTDGLVTEIGEGKSSGGRRPKRLRFSGGENYVVGIDLGTTNIYGVLADLDANIIAEKRLPTHMEAGFEAVMEQTASIIDDLKAQLGGNGKRILGIGMAVTGLINRDKNIVEFSPNFHWHDVDVVSELKQYHNFPIIFDNVTRVMALGELSYGIGKTLDSFICVNVGYGIGAGIIIDGKPLYGPIGMAGEFGHITLNKDSKAQCDCGSYGCLEVLASGSAIARAAHKAVDQGASSCLTGLCGGVISQISTQMVAEAAEAGDALSTGILDTAFEYLGIGISNLINLFTPEAVVIGGGVAQAGDVLFDSVDRVVRSRALRDIARDTVIQPSTFGPRAAVMGAVALILQDVLSLDQTDHIEMIS